MKIRVEIPEHIRKTGRFSCVVTDEMRTWVDDILLWGMETEMDVAFYGYHHATGMNDWWSTDHHMWAVFTVEADYSWMFTLKWNATQHKGKKKR